MRKLVLFDIDGTLLYSQGNARYALLDAIKKVCGNNINESISMAGKTDRLIIYDVLSENYSKNEVLEIFPKIVPHYLESLKNYFTKDRGVGVFDGVMEILLSLKDKDEILLGLLTGNIKEGAQIKLGVYDLFDFFQLGAFGDDGFYRNELPDVAVKRAKDKFNKEFIEKDIIIIGDTIHDVECGRHLGVKSIAVCSNKSMEKELRDSKPDYFFDDLTNVPEVLNAILE